MVKFVGQNASATRLVWTDLSQNEIDTMRLEIQEEGWDFDPDLHSAGHHVESVLENAADKADETAFFSRAAQAWKWFQETMELDLAEMEKRWHEFPVISVKQAVSDSHGLEEQKSLYAYLDNVRKAYVVGADLAALAMCRSITEILFRFHYNKSDEKTNLSKLIKKTVERQTLLNSYNLDTKVYEANKLLHFSGEIDSAKWQDVRVLVRNWFLILNELIDQVPVAEKN